MSSASSLLAAFLFLSNAGLAWEARDTRTWKNLWGTFTRAHEEKKKEPSISTLEATSLPAPLHTVVARDELSRHAFGWAGTLMTSFPPNGALTAVACVREN